MTASNLLPAIAMDGEGTIASGAASDGDAAALSAGVARGDAAAVEVFYRRHFDRLYAEARRATRRDEAFCLDVVHDAVLKMLRSIRPVRSDRQLLAWLKLVVRTAALDLLRAERRRHARESLAASRPSAAPPDAAERDEQTAWLRAQVEALDPEIVRLIEMRYVKQWTLARIAAWVGASVGTIDGRLRRALHRLRDAAEEVDDV